MRYVKWISLGALAALPALAGCDAIECADSTIEIDGECVAADFEPDPASCGTGTHYDETSGQCEADSPPTECGPNTVPELQPDGTTICVGMGGGGCDGAFACAAPDANKVSLCGQLYDVGTGAMIRAVDAEGMECDPFSPTVDGPCSLGVGTVDPVAFQVDPENPVQIPVDELYLDDCGRFRAINTERPAIGFVGLAIDDITDTGDLTGTPIQETVVGTGMVILASAGETIRNWRGYSLSRATDEAWRVSAGDPFGGQTFSDVGVYMGVFLHGDTPAPDVVLTGGGATRPDDDYYFAVSDTGTTRMTVDVTRDATGPNGAGLFINSTLGLHGGTGGEPAGCDWPSDLAGTVAGVIFFQEKSAHVEGDPDTPCP